MENSAPKNKPYCLSIAGFDPTGGAGLAADLRVFGELGAVGVGAVTALTPQNSGGVKAVEAASPAILRRQLEAIFEDCIPAAAKTGQIPTIENAREIVRILRRHPLPFVVDPVAFPTLGKRLATEECARYVKKHLLPLCRICTPNAREASWLSGLEIHSLADAEKAARKIVPSIAPAVVITGLIEAERICDLFFDGNSFMYFRRKLLNVGEVHGTGCHFSAALCAYLALGCTSADAVKMAGRRMSYWLKNRLLDPAGRMKTID